MRRTAPIPELVLDLSHIDQMRQKSVTTHDTRQDRSRLADLVKSGSSAIHLDAKRTIAPSKVAEKRQETPPRGIVDEGEHPVDGG